MNDIERIVNTIGSRPVLGHWPHMQAHKDIEILRALAAELVEANAALDRYAHNPPWDRVPQLEAALRKAVNYYTGHFGWCAKNGQMPMERGRAYLHPTDWDNWRATVACTCDVEKLLPQTETKRKCPECVYDVRNPFLCERCGTPMGPTVAETKGDAGG